MGIAVAPAGEFGHDALGSMPAASICHVAVGGDERVALLDGHLLPMTTASWR